MENNKETKWSLQNKNCEAHYRSSRKLFSSQRFKINYKFIHNILFQTISRMSIDELFNWYLQGTLGVTYMAVEFNFQQILLKTLIPTINTLEDMAVLNIIKTVGKCAPEAKRKEFFAVIFNLNQLCIKKLNSRTNTKQVSSARGEPWL